MAVVVVRRVVAETTEAGDPVLRLFYDLPGGPKSAGDRDEHEHIVPLPAVWARVEQYGITKAEALELVVLEVVAASDLPGWPHTAAQVKTARGRHDVATVRRFADMVPDPTPAETSRIRRALRIDPRRTVGASGS